MNNGLWTVRLRPDDQVAAAQTGILLGTGAQGLVRLRLLRQPGTRIAVASGLGVVQVLALRAAVAGVAVEIVTARVAAWQPLLASAPAARVRGFAQVDGQPGPGVVVYDYPADDPANCLSLARPAAEVRPWQCRIDVRQQWTNEQARALATADLAIAGRVPPQDGAALATAFELPSAALEALPRLTEHVFALLRRRRLEYVTVAATVEEQRAAEAAGAQLTAPRIAP
jgi:hypothetical protein